MMCALIQESTNFSILPSQMGERGVSWENMEITENMEKINPVTYNTLFMIQNTQTLKKLYLSTR